MAICGQIAVRVHNIAQIVAGSMNVTVIRMELACMNAVACPFRSTISSVIIIDKTQPNRRAEPRPKNRHFFGCFLPSGRNIGDFSAKRGNFCHLAENMLISRPECSECPRFCRFLGRLVTKAASAA